MANNARVGINVTAALTICFRLMDLKAFLKSICKIPSSCESCNFSNVIWSRMIPSAPPLTPTPSCLDEKSSANSVCVCLAMHFEKKKSQDLAHSYRTNTTFSPFNLFKAVKEELQKTGATVTFITLNWRSFHLVSVSFFHFSLLFSQKKL